MPRAREVVVVTVSDDDPLEPAGTQRVIPPPQTTGPTADGPWYPFNVTWSPDGTTLLYLAFMEGGPNSVVAAPVDGETPPVVLSGRLDVVGVLRVPVAAFPELEPSAVEQAEPT